MIANTLILCHILRIVRLGRPWTIFIQILQGTPVVYSLVYQRMVSNIITLIVVRLLMTSFCHALQYVSQQMSKIRVYIPCPCHSESYGTEEANKSIFAFVDGRAERTMGTGRCIWLSSEMSTLRMQWKEVPRIEGMWRYWLSSIKYCQFITLTFIAALL
jgi:hypothetical protein